MLKTLHQIKSNQIKEKNKALKSKDEWRDVMYLKSGVPPSSSWLVLLSPH